MPERRTRQDPGQRTLVRAALDAPGAEPATDHPSDATFARYLRRELDPGKRDDFELHAARCARCSEDLRTATAIETAAVEAAEARSSELTRDRGASGRGSPPVRARSAASVARSAS